MWLGIGLLSLQAPAVQASSGTRTSVSVSVEGGWCHVIMTCDSQVVRLKLNAVAGELHSVPVTLLSPHNNSSLVLLREASCFHLKFATCYSSETPQILMRE